MIFTRTKRAADRVAEDLDFRGFAVAAVHGDLGQGARERALRAFRTGKIDVLVATDVAARGLDVSGVTHVINYDCPEDPDTYTHRIGRTGRAGATGVAVTFVDWEDMPRWRAHRQVDGPGHAAAAGDLPHLARRSTPTWTSRPSVTGTLPTAERTRAGLSAEVEEDLGGGRRRGRDGGRAVAAAEPRPWSAARGAGGGDRPPSDRRRGGDRPKRQRRRRRAGEVASGTDDAPRPPDADVDRRTPHADRHADAAPARGRRRRTAGRRPTPCSPTERFSDGRVSDGAVSPWTAVDGSDADAPSPRTDDDEAVARVAAVAGVAAAIVAPVRRGGLVRRLIVSRAPTHRRPSAAVGAGRRLRHRADQRLAASGPAARRRRDDRRLRSRRRHHGLTDSLRSSGWPAARCTTLCVCPGALVSGAGPTPSAAHASRYIRTASARTWRRSVSRSRNGIRTGTSTPSTAAAKSIPSASIPDIRAAVAVGAPPRPRTISTLSSAWSSFMCRAICATTSGGNGSRRSCPALLQLGQHGDVQPVGLGHLGQERVLLGARPGDPVQQLAVPGPERRRPNPLEDEEPVPVAVQPVRPGDRRAQVLPAGQVAQVAGVVVGDERRTAGRTRPRAAGRGTSTVAGRAVMRSRQSGPIRNSRSPSERRQPGQLRQHEVAGHRVVDHRRARPAPASRR